MKELIHPASAEKAFLLLAVAGPLVGIIIGAMLGAHERRALPRILAGALIGGIGTLTYAMWRVYGSITDALGLDSVANLSLQLAIFAIGGVALGVLVLKLSLFLKRMGSGG